MMSILNYFSAEVLQSVKEVIIATPNNFTKEQIVKAIKGVGKHYGLKIPVIMKLIRMTVSGLKVSHLIDESDLKVFHCCI